MILTIKPNIPGQNVDIDINNYASRPISVLLPAAPDLQVTSIVATPTTTGGNPFTITWTVENKGNAAITAGTWYDQIYLADAPNLDDSTPKWYLGIVEHSEQLAARGGKYTSELTTVLSPGAKGKYVIVKTNAGLSVWEGPNTQNNIKEVATNVTSTPADFVVTNIKTTATNSGEATPIEWTVTNTGASVWSGTRYWYDEVWISQNSDFEAELRAGKATWLGLFAQNLPNGGLGTGTSYTQKQNVILPAGINGDYYIHVFTNESKLPDSNYYSGLPAEIADNYWSRLGYETGAYEDTSNNYSSQKIPVTFREPDLEVSNLQIENLQPGINPKSGETITVSWKVANTGGRDTRENTWFDRIYLSIGDTDETLDSQDIFLGEYKRQEILKAGEFYTNRQEFILPDGISGKFKLLVFTDSNYVESLHGLGYEGGLNREYARVPEFEQEFNNKAFQNLSIDLATSPDLQVTQLIVPTTGIAGQQVNVKYTVSNKGQGNTSPRQNTWQDLVYLSRDNKLDLISDRYLGTIDHNGGLEAGKDYSIEQTFNLPIDLEGSYYIIVVTDPTQSTSRGNVYEGINERNNDLASTSAFIIQRPDPIDLEVQNIITPGNSKVGEKATVKWTVANNSNYDITGEWTDAVYLSADGKWDISDRLLGRKVFKGTLASQGSYELSLDDADIPGVTPGNYRIIVRTDILNQVYEGVNGGETNNIKPSDSTFKLDAEPLQLNVAKSTTLSKGQERLFELDVPAGQTIRITTDGNNGANEIYVGFGKAPTYKDAITASRGVIGADQSAIISNTQQGKYYVLVRGLEGSNDTVNLLSVALPLASPTSTPIEVVIVATSPPQLPGHNSMRIPPSN
ncbi:MAG: hypothetical protein HC903_21915 [Methylacidiphilales bacterium]|nr:hypothetical protein [Candidatus Methylacidiphilales bacterium]